VTEQPVSWAEARRKARERMRRMGMPTAPEAAPEPRPQDVLPTLNPFALRGLLHTGRLTPAQERAARQFLSDLVQQPTDSTHTPGDAA
jgi:hypothetical protein